MSDEQEWQKHAQDIAATITNNKALNKLLLTVPPESRKGVYQALEPYLTFEPKPNFSFRKSSPA